VSASAPASTSAWVVDASIAVKWFMPMEGEPEGRLAREAIGLLPMRTTSLAFFEVGNVLTIHSGWGEARVGAALDLLLEICGDPLDLTQEDHRSAAGLAFAHGLTFYDASYVAIARRLGRGVLSAHSDLLGPGLAENLETALS
jgi:predicted nucleic acid-binding protein